MNPLTIVVVYGDSGGTTAVEDLDTPLLMTNPCVRKWRDKKQRPRHGADNLQAGRKEVEVSALADLLGRAWHLRRMAAYKMNYGCQKQEVLQLNQDCEISAPELGTSLILLLASLAADTRTQE